MAVQINAQMMMDQNDWRRGREKLLWSMRKLNRAALQRIADVVASKARAKAPEITKTLKDSITGKVRKLRGEDGLYALVSTNTKGKPLKRGVYESKEVGEPYVNKRGEHRRKPVRKLVGVKEIPGRKVAYGYGLAVEIGKPSGRYSPTPYLRPALFDSRDEIIEIYKQESAKEAATK